MGCKLKRDNPHQLVNELGFNKMGLIRALPATPHAQAKQHHPVQDVLRPQYWTARMLPRCFRELESEGICRSGHARHACHEPRPLNRVWALEIRMGKSGRWLRYGMPQCSARPPDQVQERHGRPRQAGQQGAPAAARWHVRGARARGATARTPGSANSTTTTSSSRSTSARAASTTRRRAGRCGHPHARRRAPRAAARRRAPTPRRSRSRTWCPAELPRRQRRSRR